jgi:hypothetical protein
MSDEPMHVEWQYEYVCTPERTASWGRLAASAFYRRKLIRVMFFILLFIVVLGLIGRESSVLISSLAMLAVGCWLFLYTARNVGNRLFFEGAVHRAAYSDDYLVIDNPAGLVRVPLAKFDSVRQEYGLTLLLSGVMEMIAVPSDNCPDEIVQRIGSAR